MTTPNIPLPSEGASGPDAQGRATATCFCGTVQLSFPTTAPHLVPDGSFICNCTDCRKVSATAFGCSNFTVTSTGLIWNRGFDKLTTYSTSKTIGTGNTMTNYFCSVCGTLMNRASSGFDGLNFLRIGTVDDFNLHETLLRPTVEQFTKSRVGWMRKEGVEGARQVEGFAY